MNGALAFVLTALVYPGALVALIAAWLLGWAHASAREAIAGRAVPSPLTDLGRVRGLFARETLTPEMTSSFGVSLALAVAVAAPLAALALLPLPGSPLARALGQRGDLAGEAALLLGMPLARLFLGWIIPTPQTRYGADRYARLLVGAAPALVFALSGLALVRGALTLDHPATLVGQAPVSTVAIILAALSFLCVIPALARSLPLREEGDASEALAGEATALTGRDLALLMIGQGLQLVAVAAFFAIAFVTPLIAHVGTPVTQGLILLAVVIVVAVGAGAWEGRASGAASQAEQPPLSWWAGIPTLLGLAALVAAVWATRG